MGNVLSLPVPSILPPSSAEHTGRTKNLDEPLGVREDSSAKF